MGFSIERGDSEKAVSCPSCGKSEGLHMEAAVVDAFASEDEPVVVVIVEADGSTRLLPSGASPKPDSRRHGVGLAGWCELCGDQFLLWFRQHKGATMGSFVDLGPESPFSSSFPGTD